MNGVEFPTFKAAAVALNLLEDDTIWEATLAEAAAYQMPEQLSLHFVDICVYCNPTDALHMFETNAHKPMEDFVRNGHEPGVAKNLILKSVQDKLRLNNQTMEELSLPVPDFELIN